MYALGIPVTVTIDDSLPIDSHGNALFARVSKDKALWGPLIEKCFAKLHGNYEAIEFGNSAFAIDNLHGSPSTTHRHRDKKGNAKYNSDEMFNLIKQADANEDMISASTPGAPGSHLERKTQQNLHSNHVYTVLSAHEIQDEKGQIVKLLRLRNPFGSEKYTGPYNDNDKINWDETLKQKVRYVNDNDGTFFIDIDTYMQEFLFTQINLDTTGMTQSFFLISDDNS